MVGDTQPGPKARCSICGKSVVPEFRPFCSARCKQIDLGRWLNETYRVPVAPSEEEAMNEDDSDRD